MKTKIFGGQVFKIDRPKGFVKTWDLPGGRKKTYTYGVDYGYFPRLKGEDGEGLDAFVGDDPKGHFESFEKLKPNESGTGKVLDETKFLVGVTDNERRKIYELYSDGEVSGRRVYDDMESLLSAAQDFKGKARFQKAASLEELVLFKLGHRANPYGRAQQYGLDTDADEEHEALYDFKKRAALHTASMNKRLAGTVMDHRESESAIGQGFNELGQMGKSDDTAAP